MGGGKPQAQPAHNAAITSRRASFRARDIIDVLRAVWTEMLDDRVLAVAAGVAFFGLMSLAPAVTAFVSIYGLLVPPGDIANHLLGIAALVPESAYAIIRDQIDEVTAKGTLVLSFASVFSLGFTVWSANGSMKAMMDALNVAYGVRDRRSIVMYNVVSLSVTIGAVVLLASILVLLAGVPLLLERLWLGWTSTALLTFGRWPLLFALLVFGLQVLYRIGPDVPGARWRWISPGSVLAAAGILGFSLAFSVYSSYAADFEKTYGSLGAVIAFMIWAWLSSALVLIGAELNAELDRRRPPPAVAR